MDILEHVPHIRAALPTANVIASKVAHVTACPEDAKMSMLVWLIGVHQCPQAINVTLTFDVNNDRIFRHQELHVRALD